MEPSSAGQGKWRRQSERRTPNCRSDKTTIQRNDVPRGTMDETSSLWTLVSIALPRSVRESDDAGRLIPTRARQDACKPETKGAPRRSKDTPGKGSCDRERYPWFVAQFWTESRNRWRCRFRAADPRPRRGSAGVGRYYGAFARRAPGLA